jgi:hypothetical protein
VSKVLKLHVKLLGFSWDQEFKVLNGGPFPVTLGLDFMRRTKMSIDVGAKKFQFGFASHLTGECGNPEGEIGGSLFLQSLLGQIPVIGFQSDTCDKVSFENFSAEFPCLFSSVLGTAVCAPYEIELMDSVPVRSPSYRCAPPPKRLFSNKWLTNC